MKRVLLFFILSILFLNPFKGLFASHIVGGGFSYTYLSKNTYLIRLEYYRDCSANAADYPGGNLKIGIYGLSNDLEITTLELEPGPVIPVNFLLGDCISSPVTCVQKRVYQDTLFIDTSLFKDTSGYYFSYEQCCRNFGIVNIINPDRSGIAFYAEFPHPVKNNKEFINSSARLKNEQNVYLCVQEPFYASYEYVDPDGDSLVYSLVEPLKGTTDPVFNNSSGFSINNPKPYPPVVWNAGYGAVNNNYLDGAPDLVIDRQSGQLHVSPQNSGIYIFAILIEEYREGIKIGEVRKEIQYQIIICPVRNAPQIVWLNDSEKTIKANTRKCLQFEANDVNMDDSLFLSIDNISELLAEQSFTLSVDSFNKNKLKIEVCVETDCFVSASQEEGFRLIVSDRSCPVAKKDSFEVKLEIEAIKGVDPFEDVPNVFSPNSDGKNDFFSIHKNIPIECAEKFSLLIYNRWGEKVYSTQNFLFEWSGGGLPAGVYFYVMKLGNREKLGHLSIIY